MTLKTKKYSAKTFQLKGELKLADVSIDGEKNKRPGFTIEANSGEVFEHWLFGPTVVNLKSLQFEKTKFSALREHDKFKIVGFTTSQKTKKTGLLFEGLFSEVTADGVEVAGLLAEGQPWEASIFAPPQRIERLEVGAKAKVNGKTLKGPLTIWHDGIMKEVSFAVHGADSKTSAAMLSQKDEIDVEVFNLSDSKEDHKMTNPDTTPEKTQPSAEELSAAANKAVEADREKSKNLRVALAAAFPDRPDFVLAQLEKGNDVATAKAELFDELEDAKKLAAAKKTVGTGSEALEFGGTPEKTLSPEKDKHDFVQLMDKIQETEKLSAYEAKKLAARKNPKLHAEWVLSLQSPNSDGRIREDSAQK